MIESAYRKFCIQRFTLPGELQVAECEDRIGAFFPDEYREFLLQFNGGYFSEPNIAPSITNCPTDCLTELYGIGAPDEDTELGKQRDVALFRDNDPLQILPIGYTLMGSLILLVMHVEQRGGILLKTIREGTFLIAENIESFFGLLQESSSE